MALQEINPNLESAIQEIVDHHFQQVKNQIPEFYSQHLGSFKAILVRHWKHKTDVPKEWVHIPLKLFHWGKSRVSRNKNLEQTVFELGKDREVQQLILNDLMKMPLLEQKLRLFLLENAPLFQEYEHELQQSVRRYSEEEVLEAMRTHFEKLVIPRDGSRELMLFLAMGFVGRTLCPNITFGSALGMGSAVATSIYASQQGWLGSLWLKLTGIPGWVTISGAAMGLFVVLVTTPLISPLSELLINRLRGERFLTRMVDQFHQDVNEGGKDHLNLAGHVALYVQALPELFQILKLLR